MYCKCRNSVTLALLLVIIQILHSKGDGNVSSQAVGMTKQINSTSNSMTSTLAAANTPKTTTTTIEPTPPPAHQQSTTPSSNLCTENFGDCFVTLGHDHSFCGDDDTVAHGLCGDSHTHCCMPSQTTAEKWKHHDKKCNKKYGSCQLADAACSGVVEEDATMCGGPGNRVCCSPGEDEIANWTRSDAHCLQAFGSCQPSSTLCDGELIANDTMCGGPDARQCCVPSVAVQESWKSADNECKTRWGNCQANGGSCANGSYVQDICGGPSVRQCCVPDEATVDGWSSQDKRCQIEYGSCQHLTDSCNGTKSAESCAGPSNRVCCLPSLATMNEWRLDDLRCQLRNGTCQHSSTECDGQFQDDNSCGGPDQRICCGPLSSDLAHAHGPNHDLHRQQKVITYAVITSAAIVAAIALVIFIFLKQEHCCTPYKRVRHQNWIRPNEEENVKLTEYEANFNYA